jgi:hypothetical protein
MIGFIWLALGLGKSIFRKLQILTFAGLAVPVRPQM